MKNFSAHLSETLNSTDEKAAEVSQQKTTPSQHYFYENENRNEILNKISHLVDYTKLALFIQGEDGIGKTSVAKQCATQANENWRVSYISAKDLTNEADFIEILANDYQLHKDPDINYNDYVKTICEKIDLLKLSEETATLVIDDIELLNPTLIPLLSKFAFHTQENPPLVRLIMFGQTLPEKILTFIPQENEQAALKNLLLKPFSLSETREYMDFRLRSLNLDNHPLFDNNHIIAIHEESRGIPAKIDSLSDKLLEKLAASPINLSSKNSPLESNKQFSITALLITTGIVLLTIFMYLQESNDSQQKTDLIPLEIPDNDITHSTINSITEKPATIQTPAAIKPTLAEIVLSETAISLSKQTIPAPNILNEKPLEKIDGSIADIAPTETTTDEFVVVNEIFQTPVKSENINANNTDLAWFKSQKASDYTIQLIATSKKDAARSFIQQHNIETGAKLLKTTRNNKDWFVVLYRSYPTRATAKISRQELPAQLIKLKPWIRSFNDLSKHLP